MRGLAAMGDESSVMSPPGVLAGVGGERIGHKGSRKRFCDFVVLAASPPQDHVLAPPVLAAPNPGIPRPAGGARGAVGRPGKLAVSRRPRVDYRSAAARAAADRPAWR